MSCFYACSQVSQAYKKFSYHIFIQIKNQKNKCISMYFELNIQFIKIIRTRLIFQKYQKTYFVFFSYLGLQTYM